MEEDIKILEEIKRPTLATGFERQTKILQAIENLIKGYRELKEITNQYNAFGNDYLSNDVKIIIADREYFNNGIFKENFIPKSKIKAKIQELTNMRDTTITCEGYNILNGEIVVLQELMEDK